MSPADLQNPNNLLSRHLLAARERSAAATRPPEPGTNQTANCVADIYLNFHMFPPRPRRITQICNNSLGAWQDICFFGGGTRCPQRVIPRLRNALVMEMSRPRADWSREGAPAPSSSSEKPIHLWLRLARDTRATTAVAAAVSAATIQNEGVTRLLWESRRKASFPLLSSAQEPTAQRRAINSESFRESLSTERY